MACLQSFCLEFLLLFLLSCFSSDMVCLQNFWFLFCSFLVNFTNLSWKEFNIILIISIIYNMCCGLQLVLWFHLLALLNLGSRLQGFIWRSADKVPAWKSEQLLFPCNWWHPLGACWSACKTKPLQTGVKCSWVFCRIKVAWSCHCFAWEQMIWLNFHVKFQSIHVNITSTAHHFFSFFLFFPSHKQNLSKKKKNPGQTENKCLHTCNVYKYSEKIHFLHAFNSFQPERLLNVMWNMRYMSRETCVTIQRTFKVEEMFQYYFGICPQHQKLTRINTCSWSMVFVWSWRKSFFHVTCFSVTILWVGCSTLKWMNPFKNCT